MSHKRHLSPSVVSMLALCALLAPLSVVQAMDFGDFMNPSRWMGGKNDDRYDDDEGGPYGPAPYGNYGAPPAYGAPPYGAPYQIPYAPAPVGAPLAPAMPARPAQPTMNDEALREIEALKRRIEELESGQQHQSRPAPAPMAPSAPLEWPGAPAFRPMN